MKQRPTLKSIFNKYGRDYSKQISTYSKRLKNLGIKNVSKYVYKKISNIARTQAATHTKIHLKTSSFEHLKQTYSKLALKQQQQSLTSKEYRYALSVRNELSLRRKAITTDRGLKSFYSKQYQERSFYKKFAMHHKQLVLPEQSRYAHPTNTTIPYTHYYESITPPPESMDRTVLENYFNKQQDYLNKIRTGQIKGWKPLKQNIDIGKEYGYINEGEFIIISPIDI